LCADWLAFKKQKSSKAFYFPHALFANDSQKGGFAIKPEFWLKQSFSEGSRFFKKAACIKCGPKWLFAEFRKFSLYPSAPCNKGALACAQFFKKPKARDCID